MRPRSRRRRARPRPEYSSVSDTFGGRNRAFSPVPLATFLKQFRGEPFLSQDSMRIALIAPPFIPVPPLAYGGTELFIAHLADGLYTRGHDVTVYANGESRTRCELKWRYRRADWPTGGDCRAQLKNADHTGWAIHDASRNADVVHLNDSVGVPFTRFVDRPVVQTLHHPHEPQLSEQYVRYPDIQYVAISAHQARREPMPRVR